MKGCFKAFKFRWLLYLSNSNITFVSKRCITDKWMVRASFPIKERHVILDKNDLIWKRNIDDELKAKVIKSAICEKCLCLRQETGPEGRNPTEFFRYVKRFKPGGQIIPTTFLIALPPDFQTFLRPWKVSSLSWPWSPAQHLYQWGMKYITFLQ